MQTTVLRQEKATAIQEQFWLIHQIAPGNTAYNVVDAFNVRGAFDLAAFNKSMQEIILRHEIFRTSLKFEKGELFQCIQQDPDFSIKVIDLVAIDKREAPKNTEGVIRDVIQAEAERPFDLQKSPLMRVTILRRQPDFHIVIIVFHHSIVDLETKKLFADLLAAHYTSAKNDAPLACGQPQYQYADYSRWQQQWLKSANLETQCAYWRNSLKNSTGFLHLPADKKRPAAQRLVGSLQKISLNHGLVYNLAQFSRKNGVNIFLTLLAAYIVLLYRYSGQSDIVVGVPLTNRRQDFHKEIMGCFVNTMPLAVNVERDKSFINLLKQVRFGMLGAHRNQEISLVEILNAVPQVRDSSYNPLYQVGFTFAPPMPLVLEDLDVEPVIIHHGGSQLDIFATFWENGNGIEGYFEYNTELFEEWRIKSFADNYHTLLSAVLSDAGQPVGMLDIISAAEKKTIIETWNATDVKCEESVCVNHLFENQEKQTPGAAAIQYEKKTLTYLELNQQANQLAVFLSGMGVGPETLVGVYLARGIEMAVALLAILKAGGAYVPIDPDFPRVRIAYMLNHSQAAVVLTTNQQKNDLPESGARVICIDEHSKQIIRCNNANPKTEVGADNLAYVIYTSGSTGNPKGVQISHGAVVNFLLSMRRQPGIESNDVLLALTTLSFDISVLELFLPLVVGAKIVIVNRDTALDARLLREALQENGATFMQATPSTWRMLIGEGWSAPAGFKALCGGEPLPLDLANNLVENTGGNVWNMYGPTETTIWSTCCHLTGRDQPVTIGRPIDNTRIYLLDEDMNPVPIGVQGELYIGGVGVARGYLNNPELTQTRFLPDPFSNVEDARIYRTGDWCRYSKDGSLEFLTRIDNQVKVNGFRIELGEVESILNQHPNVNQGAVAVHEDANGNKRLVGYVISDAHPPSVESLREFLLEKLPHYMVPNLFVRLEKMPMTPNAKIDHKALPRPDIERPDMEEVFIAPSDPVEEKMAAIWQDTLSVDRIGIHDSFFVLGGNSLLGVQMIARIQKAFNTDIRVAKLFQYPTIRSLLNVLDKKEDKPVFSDFTERANLRKQAYSRRKFSPPN